MSQSHRIARLFVVTALLVAAVPVLGATYDIDGSHSSVNFQIKHLAISKVNGTFDSFEGSFEFVPGQPDQWSVAATIDAASVNTGNRISWELSPTRGAFGERNNARKLSNRRSSATPNMRKARQILRRNSCSGLKLICMLSMASILL